MSHGGKLVPLGWLPKEKGTQALACGLQGGMWGILERLRFAEEDSRASGEPPGLGFHGTLLSLDDPGPPLHDLSRLLC